MSIFPELEKLPSRQQKKFYKRLAGLKKSRAGQTTKEKIRTSIQADLKAALAAYEARLANWPRIDWEDKRWADLPVVGRLADLQSAIRDNQVVVVAGETGSGKTTQLPKICLSLGLGAEGLIGHTQPRRLAARQVAGRIAEELGGQLSEQVGYRVRFEDKSSDHNLICLMTDGMLLSEIQQDRWLSRYQVLIIDEAHERSLNIDFLLGYLKQLLPKRPDLKVIITSATIDHERMARFFDAKALEVSGRTYPVDMLYRPGDEDRDTPRQLLAIIEEIEAVERTEKGRQRLDILVFLPGERDIREAHRFLKKAEFFSTEVLPLYARLGARDQARVFQSHKGRRIVLSTNVAETSLTVPNIGYVIDTGTARISRYSVASKIQRLPVEPISQASANQRAGRAGRLMPGICFRLYDEQDFLSRPEFTDPEIRRTNLASVILTMANMKLGDIERFPFLDVPERRQIRDGRKLLFELGALDERQKLTRLGRHLARLPLDPRLARMLFAARERGVLAEVLVIVSALAVQDPCERPPDKQQQADQAHASFRDKRSDFLFYLNLWCWVEQQRADLSRNQYTKLLKRTFLSPRRMQEWRDIHRQLRQHCHELSWKPGHIDPAEFVMGSHLSTNKSNGKQVNKDKTSSQFDYDNIHRSLLSGLATLIMRRTDEGEWQSCRNRKPLVWPGSALKRNKSPWLMAAEQVETSRLFGRTLAQIKPGWVIEAVPQLLKYDYSEPHWSKRYENVLAYESIKLFGLLLASGKRVTYDRFDKALARELMIREGLVAGAITKPLEFVDKNRQKIDELAVIEHKMRRRDYLVDEEEQAAFYERVIPADIFNLAALRHWYKRANSADKNKLLMNDTFLLARDADETASGLPDHLEVEGMSLALHYQFEPSGQRDGVTLELPQSLLAVFPRWRTEWLVPGLFVDKLEALLRALPKSIRRKLVPIPDHASELAGALQPIEPLYPALTRELYRLTGVRLEQEDWPQHKLPTWLVMNIRLVDDQGKMVKESRDWADFDGLETAITPNVSDEKLISHGDWCFGHLPEEEPQELAGTSINRYPALKDDGKQVVLAYLTDQQEARGVHAQGLARLFWLHRPDVVKSLKKQASALPGFQKLTSEKTAFARTALDETLLFLLRQQLGFETDPPRSQQEWHTAITSRLGTAIPACEQEIRQFSGIYLRYRDIRVRLASDFPLSLAHVHADISTQLDDIFHDKALRDWPQSWWQAIPRYLQTIERRLEHLNKEDRATLAKLAECREQYRTRAAGRLFWQLPPELQHYRLMLEELRVSLFAQQLGTQMPVSFKRLAKQWLAC